MSEKKIDDGGPAYPFVQWKSPDEMIGFAAYNGMSLRDWFAGHALQGMIACAPFKENVRYLEVCNAAYAWADAMIAARKGDA